MAGRREKQKDVRRGRILAAATHLFTKNGFAPTAIGDIAKRARLATGTLYNYFPSKAEIAIEIVRAQTSEALQQGETVLKRHSSDPSVAVASLVDVYLDTFMHFDRDLWREILARAITDPQGMGVSFFAQDLRLIRQLDILLQELQAQDRLDPNSASGQGAIAVYSIYTTWFMAYLSNDDIDVAAVRSQVGLGIGVVMNGLVRSSPLPSSRR
jgi:AcrR family transcriptional regulator